MKKFVVSSYDENFSPKFFYSKNLAAEYCLRNNFYYFFELVDDLADFPKRIWLVRRDGNLFKYSSLTWEEYLLLCDDNIFSCNECGNKNFH